MGCKKLILLLKLAEKLSPLKKEKKESTKVYQTLYLDILSPAFRFFYNNTNLPSPATLFGRHLAKLVIEIYSYINLDSNVVIILLQDTTISKKPLEKIRSKANDGYKMFIQSVLRNRLEICSAFYSEYRTFWEWRKDNFLNNVRFIKAYMGESDLYPFCEYTHYPGNQLFVSFDSDVIFYNIVHGIKTIDSLYVANAPKNFSTSRYEFNLFSGDRQSLLQFYSIQDLELFSWTLFLVVCNGCDYLPALYSTKDDFYLDCRAFFKYEKILKYISLNTLIELHDHTLASFASTLYPYFWFIIFSKRNIGDKNHNMLEEEVSNNFTSHWYNFYIVMIYFTKCKMYKCKVDDKIIRNKHMKDFVLNNMGDPKEEFFKKFPLWRLKKLKYF